MYGTVRESGARDLVTLVKPNTPVPRPESVPAERHLIINISDITEAAPGEVLAEIAHVERLIGFVQAWERQHPLLIHCYAGVSRSTAAAFITACALTPELDELALARRMRAVSPTATPNAHLVAIGDALLQRQGRMIEAVAAIGRGESCFEGIPFALALAEMPLARPHAEA